MVSGHSSEITEGALDPEFSFRFPVDEIRGYYRALEDAFQDGAYLLVAEFAEAGSELQGCGLVLGGALGRGLSLLNAQPHLSSRGVLCKAFGEWSLGRNTAAIATLSAIPNGSYSTKAAALRQLIERDDITVFVTAAFLPVPTITTASTSAREAVHRYGQFVVKQVGTQLETNAYDYELHEPFDDFIGRLPAGEQPDFIFSLTPLWIPPKNFEKVAIPKVIWCHDGDVFSYRAFDNLSLFDVRIVHTAQEHFELSRAFGKFCVSNFMLDPLGGNFPQCRAHTEKEFDVIFTGSAFDAFHAEKSRFIYKLAALGDRYKIAIFDGYLAENEYYDLLSRSKFLPIVNRYAGCPSPRWRDALANSAHVLFPEGTTFGKAFPGCFSYGADSITGDIRAHLDKYEAGDPAYDVRRSAAEVDAEMAVFRDNRDEIFERLLKLAAFSSLVMRPVGRTGWRKPARRLIWLTPCIDPPIYGRDNIRAKIAQLADATDETDLADEQDINNLAHLYGQLALYFTDAPEAATWRGRADALFEEGCRRHPTSLLLWFNKAHWTFFKTPDGPAAAAPMLRRLLDRWEQFKFDPIGAEVAFAYTLLERDPIFPYYEYAQHMTCYAAHSGQPGGLRADMPLKAVTDMLRGAAYGYLGWEALKNAGADEGLGYLQKSLAICPDNLMLLRFVLDTSLAHSQSVGAPDPMLANDICNTFLTCANKYPALLLTHTYRMCNLFLQADRTKDLRRVLESWYRLGNITYGSNVEERYGRESDRFAAMAGFSEHFPARLRQRLSQASGGGALTQFESLIARAVAGGAGTNLAATSAPSPVPPAASLPAAADAGAMRSRTRAIDQEIAAMAGSRSWQLTRPLRIWNARMRVVRGSPNGRGGQPADPPPPNGTPAIAGAERERHAALAELQRAERELAVMTQSRSWQLTRPLRLLNARLGGRRPMN